jgi:hypothetical protein
MPDILLIEDELGVQGVLSESLIEQGSDYQIYPDRDGRLICPVVRHVPLKITIKVKSMFGSFHQRTIS